MRFMPPQTGNPELDFFLLELSRAFQNKTGLLPEEADGLYEPVGAAAAAIADHLAEVNPHPQYHTAAEVAADIATAIANHLAAADPHSQYVTTDGTSDITDIQAITKSVSGSVFTALSLRNPVATTVSTSVQLELRPNPTSGRGALIRSTQSNAGDYATLGFYIVNNAAPQLAFDINRFAGVTFYEDLTAGALNSNGGFSNGGRAILTRSNTSHEAWVEYRSGANRYWFHGFTPDTTADFVLKRYNDSGVFQDNPLSVSRSTGLATLLGLAVAGASLGMGYGTGAGGTVTQGTSETTSVTLDRPTGRITGFTVALGANTATEFVVNNSVVTQYDNIILTPVSGFNGSDQLRLDVTNVTTGAFTVRIINPLGSASANTARVFNFAVIKGVNA
jgi:hypothetical protein